MTRMTDVVLPPTFEKTASFTSGPWKYIPSHIAEGPSEVRHADGWLICCTCSDEFARLIAAAPELLAALRDALRSSRKDFRVGPEGDRQHREAYAEQFATIAKAGGGAA